MMRPCVREKAQHGNLGKSSKGKEEAKVPKLAEECHDCMVSESQDCQPIPCLWFAVLSEPSHKSLAYTCE